MKSPPIETVKMTNFLAMSNRLEKGAEIIVLLGSMTTPSEYMCTVLLVQN